jgi:hypothetical protein
MSLSSLNFEKQIKVEWRNEHSMFVLVLKINLLNKNNGFYQKNHFFYKKKQKNEKHHTQDLYQK